MKKSKKIIGISLLVTGALVAVCYLLYKKGKKAEEAKKAASDDETTTTTSGTATFPLKYNSRGTEVKNLQKALNVLLADAAECDETLPTYNNKNITVLQEDGIFGARTEAACSWHFGKKQVTEKQYKALIEATIA